MVHEPKRSVVEMIRAPPERKERMTAPNICEYCGACLDAGEKCDCREEKAEHSDECSEK